MEFSGLVLADLKHRHQYLQQVAAVVASKKVDQHGAGN